MATMSRVPAQATGVHANRTVGVAHQVSGAHFYRRWIFACAAGELIGIGAAAGAAVALNTFIGEPQSIAARLLTLATFDPRAGMGARHGDDFPRGHTADARLARMDDRVGRPNGRSPGGRGARCGDRTRRTPSRGMRRCAHGPASGLTSAPRRRQRATTRVARYRSRVAVAPRQRRHRTHPVDVLALSWSASRRAHPARYL